MKIVKPSAAYVEMDDIQHTHLMEHFDRIGYESEDKITADSAGKIINFDLEKIEDAFGLVRLFVCS